MRLVKIIIFSWLLLELGLWIRGGRGFCVLDALPFVQRTESFSPQYDWLALAALLIGLWGYCMLPRSAPDPSGAKSPIGPGILLAPVAVIVLVLVSQRVQSALPFEDVVGNSAQVLEHRYLALLCLCIFAVLLAIKALRKGS